VSFHGGNTSPNDDLRGYSSDARVPIVAVDMSPEEKSNARWIYEPRRPWRMRGLVSSFLEIPSELDDYWRGAPKQELRRRTSQAKRAGFKVRAVESSEIIDVIAQVYNYVADGRVHEIEIDLRKTKRNSEMALL
jgi:hypothetical protein